VTNDAVAREKIDMTRALYAARKSARLVAIDTREFPLPAARPLNSVLDNSKLISTFGVRLTDWEEQLRGCVAELTPEIVGAQ